MSYLPPQSVTAPKDRWKLLGVIYDAGEDDASVAYGEWDKIPCLTSRWNGSLSHPSSEKGNPTSHLHPTWFILPDFMAQATLKELLISHALGNNFINYQNLLKAIKALTPESK